MVEKEDSVEEISIELTGRQLTELKLACLENGVKIQDIIIKSIEKIIREHRFGLRNLDRL